jgi:predicted O-methyltransferase YrrM
MMARVVNALLWRVFEVLERAGVHALPVHFYSPIPEMRKLRRERDRFDVEHPMPGVDMSGERQLRLLETVVKPWEAEYRRAAGGEFGLDAERMPSFAPINALVLYALIRHLKPSRMVEVGSGTSTAVAAAAFRANREDGVPGSLITIDPHASSRLRVGIDGVTQIVPTPVEEVDLDLFRSLDDGDIVFIDSTHTVRIFGDVNHLYLTVLPQLRPGVVVHVHDIFFPVEYRPHHFFRRGMKQIWQEQYLLHAFLLFNSAFRVLLCNSYVHLKHRPALTELFPWYHAARWPSSFWMRRVSADDARSL